MKSLIATLSERGLLDAVTHEHLEEILQKQERVKVYCGFDPTAKSLHVGNLVALIVLAWFRKLGHDIVILIGGATGMIGDPSGKKKERQLLDHDTLTKNVESITQQIQAILDRVPGTGSIEMVNNYDWYKKISCIDFLRDIGKEFRLGQMLSKESVKTRIQSEEGISYTEFSYQLLQGYDFFFLFSEKKASIQIGGSDQWGNITAGIEYIRKREGKEAYGITFPLLLQKNGEKFGKSEKGALWLSADLLSEYELYQYFISLADEEVIRLLKVFTFVDLQKIEELEKTILSPDYVPNSAQKWLAKAVVSFVHGEEGVVKAEQMTSAILPGQKIEYTEENIVSLKKLIEPIEMDFNSSIGRKIIDILDNPKIGKTKSEIRRLIQNKGISLNGTKIECKDLLLKEENLIAKRYFVITIGKKDRFIMELS